MPLGDPQPPASERANPYLPSGPPPLVFEKWRGIDTSNLRAGVSDEQAAWLDGFFPISDRNLRTLPGVGAVLYTAPGGRTILFFGFYNISTTPYMAVFLDDGSAVQVRTTDGATTTIMGGGTITSPSITSVGITQWGNQYLIIVSSQTNGYWLWDGATLTTAGTLAPTVTITNVGAAYKTAPNVVITGGHGTGATIVASVSGGHVTGASVTNPGTGYLATDTVSLTFQGGTGVGSGGSLNAIMAGGTGGTGATLALAMGSLGLNFFVTSASVVTSGSGYSAFTPTNITASGGAVSGTNNAVVAITIVGGVVSAVSVSSRGAYLAATPVPTATVTDAGLFYVGSVSVVAAGSGYSPTAAISFAGGGSPVAQAAGLLNLNAGGSITSVSVTSPGAYGASAAPTISITDVAVVATGTASLMPFAIQGTAVETYQGHVWVANGATIYYSAVGSFSDFGSSSAGNVTSNDSFLKVNYSQLINTNGFLWLIGDSSVNYIGGVQTTGSPAVTSFTNQNADPQVGSPYPASVETFGHDILMANAVGVHVANGNSVTKISDNLDGVWNTVVNFGALQLSASQCYVFGKKAWVVLSRIVNPVSGATENKLFLWHNKQWFPSGQNMTLTFVKHQEINSVITAYGTDGSTIRPLFTTPSTGFIKTAQSKLWDAPGSYLLRKATGRFWGVANYNSTLLPNLIVNIDQQAPAQSAGYTITGPTGTGYFVIPPQAVGQVGELTGMTVQTSAADMSLVSLMMSDEVVAYRG